MLFRSEKAPGVPSDPSTAFVDDLSLVASGPRAVTHARGLVRLAVLWGRWAGITINLRKSRCVAIDFATNAQVDTSSIRCEGEPIKTLCPTEPFRHLGILLTLTLDFQYEKAKILGEIKKRVDMLVRAKTLTPSQREAMVQLVVVSVFR